MLLHATLLVFIQRFLPLRHIDALIDNMSFDISRVFKGVPCCQVRCKSLKQARRSVQATGAARGQAVLELSRVELAAP